jgi:hypothetical protein
LRDDIAARVQRLYSTLGGAPPAAIAPWTTNVAAYPLSKLARALMERGLLATTTDGVPRC